MGRLKTIINYANGIDDKKAATWEKYHIRDIIVPLKNNFKLAWLKNQTYIDY